MQSPTPNTLRTIAGRLIAWWFVSAVAVGALALVVTRIPPHLKIPGLFAVGYGLLAGLILQRTAGKMHVHDSTPAFLSALALILAGQIGLAVDAHRQYLDRLNAELESQAADEGGALSALVMIQQLTPPDDPESRAQFDEIRETLRRAQQEQQAAIGKQRPFTAFLRARHPRFSNWPPHAPTFFWGFEVLLGCLLGGWLTLRQARKRYCTACRSWYERRQSTLVDASKTNELFALLKLPPPAGFDEHSQIALEYTGCRCPQKPPSIDCVWERGSHRKRLLKQVDLDSETHGRLSGLLAGNSSSG